MTLKVQSRTTYLLRKSIHRQDIHTALTTIVMGVKVTNISTVTVVNGVQATSTLNRANTPKEAPSRNKKRLRGVAVGEVKVRRRAREVSITVVSPVPNLSGIDQMTNTMEMIVVLSPAVKVMTLAKLVVKEVTVANTAVVH